MVTVDHQHKIKKCRINDEVVDKNTMLQGICYYLLWHDVYTELAPNMKKL